MEAKDKTKKEMDSAISIKLPSELLEKAREKSEETGVSISFIVRKCLEKWVKSET